MLHELLRDTEWNLARGIHAPQADSPPISQLGQIRDSLHPLGERLGLFAILIAFFSLVTVLIFWSWLAHLHSALIGPPEDNMQDFWNTWYAVTGHGTAHFFATNLLRFPEGTSLLYQSFAYPQIAVVLGLSRIFGTGLHTLVALQNAILLASFPIAGVGAFYLVRHLTHSVAGGLIGGFVFAFNPSHVAHVMHHAHVSSIEFIPFFVLAYLLALERQSRLWLGTAAVLYALSALCCWYYLFYGAYFIGFHLLYQRVRDRGWPRGWHLVAPLTCILAALAILSPLIVPMIMVTRPFLYDEGGNIAVADLLSYIAFPPEHLLSGLTRSLYARFTGVPWESTAYLGLINLAVVCWQTVRTGFARDSLMFYVVFGMATFSILACGETLHVAGVVTALPLPDIALDRLPFVANVRTPSRAIVFVYLFLSIGVGYAAATLLRGSRIGRRTGIAALAVLIVLDFYPANLSATPVACSPELTTLKADPERGFGVLNLPFGYAEENAYMLEQVCHRRPMVGGMTTREMGTTLLYRLSLTNLTRLHEQLVQARVKYVLLHRPRNGLFRWNKEIAPLYQFLKSYRLVHEGPDMIVLRVY